MTTLGTTVTAVAASRAWAGPAFVHLPQVRGGDTGNFGGDGYFVSTGSAKTGREAVEGAGVGAIITGGSSAGACTVSPACMELLGQHLPCVQWTLLGDCRARLLAEDGMLKPCSYLK
jgi:hypothetical protein